MSAASSSGRSSALVAETNLLRKDGDFVFPSIKARVMFPYPRLFSSPIT